MVAESFAVTVKVICFFDRYLTVSSAAMAFEERTELFSVKVGVPIVAPEVVASVVNVNEQVFVPIFVLPE